MIFSLPSVVCAYSLPEAKLNGPDRGASSMMFHSVCPLNRLTAYKAPSAVPKYKLWPMTIGCISMAAGV